MDTGRRPRLCHMVKWQNYDGYGFNLHAEKHKTGHYIGNVDEDSPASHAGLLEGDRVIEVNGTSVVNYTHAQVVNAIKENPDETQLLVVDPLTDTYFEEENIPINGQLKNILLIKGDPPANRIRAISQNVSTSNNPSSESYKRPTTPQPPSVGASPTLAVTPPDKQVPPETTPQLRLCQLREKAGFNGYGFNLHYEQGAADPMCTHYIGKVDAESPAQLGGLRRGDVLVEINGTPVSELTHDQIVDVIKSDPDQVSMLVADRGSMETFKQMGIKPSRHWGNIMLSPAPVTPTSSPSTTSNVSRAGTAKSSPLGDRSPYVTGDGLSNGERTPAKTALSPASAGRHLATAAPVVASATAVAAGEYVPTKVGNPEPCADLPPVKFCHLRKWPDFEGYGFNLHAGKNGVGHYIGHIDPRSPADLAGLVEGDRIVDVNGENVENLDHKLVVQKIRSDPEEASLLVVDDKVDDWFASRNIAITPRWDNLVEYRTPRANPAPNTPPLTTVRGGQASPTALVPINVAAQRTPDWKRGRAPAVAARTQLENQAHDGVERRPIGSGGRYTGGREDVSGGDGSPSPLGSALPGVAYAPRSSPGGLAYDNFAERKAREVITTSQSEVTDGDKSHSPSGDHRVKAGGLVLHPHRGSVPPVPPTHLFQLYSWSGSAANPDYGLELCDRLDIAEGATFIRDVRLGSPAYNAGVRPDTLVLEVNNVPVFGKSVFEVQKRVDESYPELKILVHDPSPVTLSGGNAPTTAHKITSLPKFIEGSRTDPSSTNNHMERADFIMGDNNKPIGLNGSLKPNANGNDPSNRTPKQGSDPWNLSASEMRAKIAMDSKKKKDQKLDNRPLKEKYDLLQKM